MGGDETITTTDPQRLSPVLVGQAMHRGVFTCHSDASGLTAARVMAAHRVHSVVVVDDDHRCVGVITEADIAAAVHSHTIGLSAAEIGSAPPLVAPDDSVLRAAQLMHEHERSHVVVVDPSMQSPIGVLSVLDLVDLLADDR